ncbi:hypothetical protein WSM22_32220 [Cytophagales bacterium WSM2-2]|nr:hypothetical protein WSM22_32220 [Cytophagales bacterium WSM2-2]
MLPVFSKAFVGVRYTYTHFNTDSSSQFSRDYFHSTELWGGYNFGRLQVMAFVPYLSIHKRSDDGDVNTSGMGDIILLGNYQLYSTPDTMAWRQTFWLGGGVKLPTGQSMIAMDDPEFNVGEFTGTPGTGSIDYLLTANHQITFGNGGVVSNLTYRVNSTNDQQFRYGNRTYFSSSYFHSWIYGTLTFRPSLGVNLVLNTANRFQDQKVENSDGYVFTGMAGVNVQRNKIGLAINAFQPLSQDIYRGLTQLKERVSVALTYSF